MKLTARHAQLDGLEVVRLKTGSRRTPLAGAYLGVSPGQASANLAFVNIRKGARIRITRVLEGHVVTRTDVLPPNVKYPPLDWRKAKFFDSHGHLARRMPMEDLARTLRKNRIIYGVLSFEYIKGRGHSRTFLGDWPVHEAMRKYPDVIVGFGHARADEGGWGGPTGRMTTPADIERLHRLGFRGLKCIEKWGRVNVDDPRMMPVWAKAAELGMPVVFHTNRPWTTMCGGGRVAAVAKAHPKLPGVALAHACKPENLPKLYEALRTMPNLYMQHMHYNSAVKLAGFKRSGVAAKIVFGTDTQLDPASILSSAARFTRAMESAGFTEAESRFCRVGYAEKWLDEARLRRPEGK